MSGIQEAGRHNPTKHSYGSIDEHYEQDLLEFEKPYQRKCGLYYKTVDLAEPRFPQVPVESKEQHSSAPRQPPPAAAATSFSAAELQAMSRQNVRTFHDPEDRFLFPQTSSQQVGWGAKKMPPSTVRYPRKASALTKTMERLRAVHG